MNFFNVFLFFLTLSWKFYILLENHLQNVNQQDIIFVFTRLHGNVIKVSLNRPTPHSLFFYKIHFEWVVWFNSEAKRTNFVTNGLFMMQQFILLWQCFDGWTRLFSQIETETVIPLSLSVVTECNFFLILTRLIWCHCFN